MFTREHERDFFRCEKWLFCVRDVGGEKGGHASSLCISPFQAVKLYLYRRASP
jgi:hypothetical protein